MTEERREEIKLCLSLLIDIENKGDDENKNRRTIIDYLDFMLNGTMRPGLRMALEGFYDLWEGDKKFCAASQAYIETSLDKNREAFKVRLEELFHEFAPDRW